MNRVQLARRKTADYLSSMTIFQDLSSREIADLERMLGAVVYRRGQAIYDPDVPAERLFLLKEREVEIFRMNADGKKLVLARLGPGSIFGEMTIIGQRLHRSFATALTDCLVCVMTRSDVERALLSDPRIARRLVEYLGTRLAEIEDQVEERAFKNVPARLAGLLLRLANRRDWRGRRVVEGLTHQQLAELLGTYRETVTATLDQFRDRGLLEIGRKRIVFLDAAGLAHLASQANLPGAET
ncbi:MAG: Crp/Fnr family transcriptional regulator [Thermomicrobium sp.]|nr:Crp/Fnr family transcriptional regulator [Thermomicrobium sp.]